MRPNFNRLDLLPVGFQHPLSGVRQASEGQGILTKITGKCPRIFRTNDKDYCISFFKLCEVLAQLRHVRAAERSHKTTIKDQQDILAAEIGKSNWFASVVSKAKFRSGGVNGDM